MPAVSSIGASAPNTTLEFDEDVLDVAMQESPSDKVEESGQGDRTGVLAETAAIPWPDILTSEAGVDAYFAALDDTQENSRAGNPDKQHTNRRASPPSQPNDFHSERSHTALAGHHTPISSAAVPLPAPRGMRDADAQRDSHMRKGQLASVCHHYRKAGG